MRSVDYAIVGGVGMRRGRPETRPLRVGDAVDFWRVQAYISAFKSAGNCGCSYTMFWKSVAR